MAALPLDRYFEGIGVVTMRSAWDDPHALFVGVKGGSNAVNHSHLDLGSFVLEADGVRWGLDLGSDDYNMPAYFGNQRWTYYRLRAEGQNTIVLNPGSGPEQSPRAEGAIVDHAFQAPEASASVDLSSAYADALAGGTLVRRVGLARGRSRAMIEDMYEPGANPVALDAWWFMHTRAEIQIDPSGRGAILSQDGRRLAADLVSPPDAVFTVMDALPLPTSPAPPMQNKNQGVRRLTIHTTLRGSSTIRVVLRPLGADEPLGSNP
ncbi:MAG: heparinase II/III family protein [Phycisphaerales bacterium]|nr:heparinase II/III family protein [Phycisphaerales bacterium]